MPSKAIVTAVFLIIAASTASGMPGGNPAQTTHAEPAGRDTRPGKFSGIKLRGSEYRLRYDTKHLLVILVANGKSHVIERIPRSLDPGLVDADGDIALLPVGLQPYLGDNKLLYVSIRRSSSGDGMGECGAGVEETLNVVDVASSPRVISRILISSCLRNIALAGSETKENNYAAFSVENGKLHVDFIHYQDQGKNHSVLRDDLRGLDFN
ncbi:MAG: hypothetical protein QM599_04340 [Pseudoxanthomonas sp.]